MTKAEIVTKIAYEVGLEKDEILKVVEAFMTTVKKSMISGEEVTLRGFGSFINKSRAEKVGRNISKEESVVIPAHCIPSFKPAKEFVEAVKKNVPYHKKK
ncbi:MAG: HU family DNA-binding protein [Flavobacteriales bacterium AspAUS03]